MNEDIIKTYPFISDILNRDPAWLDCAVDAKEAAKITGLSVDSLARYRSRSGGPKYLRPVVNGQELRVVRYMRRDLYEWLFSGGRRSHTFDEGKPR